MLKGKNLLLIISGGIAAYKVLELIRGLRKAEVGVRCILTRGGAQFVTPLSVSALSENKVYQDLFSLTDESEMGHIRLSREADLVVVAPASADILARMAAGMADDLATTALLATDKPVMVAPAMNVCMWAHPATRENIARLRDRGVTVVGPAEGDLACGETGPGRMVEPDALLAAIAAHFDPARRPLAGRRALVTSGPTYEPIDPVRVLANRSSGKQGHAIAAALAEAGALVTLVSGPVALADPPGVATVTVETATEMLAACHAALPADILVCAAAVADWRVADPATGKIKKTDGGPPALAFVENPDILATLSTPGAQRPALCIGFAAETDPDLAKAEAKRVRKGCDWLLVNDVSAARGTFGGARNQVTLLRDGADPDPWPEAAKTEIAGQLATRIATHFPPNPETTV